ncbi:uncharacterized protein LOC112203888 [Rosa chinensis]|uniref:uncharacterized protein LOC112203888 n=1 Tax=Rosa chinensis TaxID=74649 RepID=UPI000D086D7B|nr:uncharacterized protein LOC112203888 [Rosa chinensis]
MACHAFEETLTDEALRWFLNLPTNSIDSFQELRDKFLRWFILCGSSYCTTPHLFPLKQRPNEGLRDLVRRWQKQATQCRSLDPALAAKYDTFGHDTGANTNLVNVPQLNNPNESTDNRCRDANRDKPSQQDERAPRERPVYSDKRDKQYSKSLEKAKHNLSSSRYRNAPYSSNRYKKTPKYDAPRYEIYTTLTTSYEDMWNNHKDIIPCPPKCRPGQEKPQDNSKYYIYHEEAGHPTNICWELKNAIKHLIQNGKLLQYHTPATGSNDIEVYGHILTIHDGALSAETLHLPKRQCPRGQEILGLSHGCHTPQVDWD